MKQPRSKLSGYRQRRFYARLLGQQKRTVGLTLSYLLAALVAWSAYRTPHIAFVARVQYAVSFIGARVILAHLAIDGVPSARRTGRRDALLWARDLAFYLLAILIIGAWGDGVYRWTIINAQPVLPVAVALVIVVGALILSADEKKSRAARVTPTRAAVAAAPQPLSPRDRCYIAAHEAGHALFYAALPRLPRDMSVDVYTQRDAHGRLGATAASVTLGQLAKKRGAKWYMHVLLAGQQAEAQVIGHRVLGSGDDYRRWTAAACAYLSNDSRGVYFHTTQSQSELNANLAQLKALKARQTATVARVLSDNAGVLNQMVATLLENGTIDRDTLAVFLSRVVLPPNFPRPSEPHHKA